MAPNPTIMRAVEHLGYRVTVGDVATQAGLNVNMTEAGLLALASDAGGHLQVAETGEIVYLFPKNFRSILNNKFLRLRLKEWWEKIWKVLFYLIRISFGIILIASIVLIFVAIAAIMIAASASRDDDSGSHDSGGGGMIFMPRFWFGPDIWWFFYPDYGDRYERRRVASPEKKQMNFLEGVFSFLFGDGNPNADLEERRWSAIATVIRNNGGAVTAEQIAPYLDETGSGWAKEYEDYMLPVLTKFNGKPEVSPDGDIVYHFPDLQITAQERNSEPVGAYLRERPWRFSQATSGQNMLSAGLGAVNIVGALVLGSLLRGEVGVQLAQSGGLIAFVQSIYWILLGYGTAFLAIPLIRYFWIQFKNKRVESRNQKRQDRAILLNQANSALQKKIIYAQQFAAKTVLGRDDLAYTTENDLIEQEIEQSDKIDAEWQRRLNQSGS